MVNDSIEQARKRLICALQADRIDFHEVVRLSGELSDLDPEFVRFSVDAAHVNQLGRELVARIETAVSELVKNAFDADATRAELTFSGVGSAGGVLTIVDDGNGMTRQELVDGFMRLSSRHKREQPLSPRFSRRRAGRKGIGRFAAQRLGRRLVVKTQTADATEGLLVRIDWDRFRDGTELGAVSSRIEKIPKERQHGTTLVIEDLADAWTESSIRRVYRYLADLQQPFPLAPVAGDPEADPGFQVVIHTVQGGQKSEIASVEEVIYDHALAEIDGYVSEDGEATWALASRKLGINELAIELPRPQNAGRSFQLLGNVRLKAYYYIYEANLLPRNLKRTINEMAKTRGGIRVYRNGFRVLPYGEQLNDWLELDAKTARRTVLPPFANNNFFGFVEITDTDGTLFEETASREGLIENEAYDELVEFASSTLQAAVNRIAEARSRKTAGQQRERHREAPIRRLETVSKQISTAVDDILREPEEVLSRSSPTQRDSRRLLAAAVEELEQVQRSAQEAEAERIAEIGMLRVLAGLGLTIGEFTHEIRHRLPPIQASARAIITDVASTEGQRAGAEKLLNDIRLLQVYTAQFDSAVASNVRRELRPLELRDVVRPFVEVVRPGLAEYETRFDDPDFEGFELYTTPMHPSEWSSILLNLFTNARKAIIRVGGGGAIDIRARRREDDVLSVEFSDTGDGIPQENWGRVFDAFFTTTAAGGPTEVLEEDITGTGLGLKIVRDIVEGYGGQIAVVPPSPGFSTTIEILVPAASAQELEDHGI